MRHWRYGLNFGDKIHEILVGGWCIMNKQKTMEVATHGRAKVLG